jgi:hypothetical protein
MNNNLWLEEQLNQEHRRDLERYAEEARVSDTDSKPTVWQWLQKRKR